MQVISASSSPPRVHPQSALRSVLLSRGRGDSPQPRSPANGNGHPASSASTMSSMSALDPLPYFHRSSAAALSPKHHHHSVIFKEIVSLSSEVHDVLTRYKLTLPLPDPKSHATCPISELSGADARSVLRSVLRPLGDFFARCHMSGIATTNCTTPRASSPSLRAALMKPSFMRSPTLRSKEGSRSRSSGPVPPLTSLATCAPPLASLAAVPSMSVDADPLPVDCMVDGGGRRDRSAVASERPTPFGSPNRCDLAGLDGSPTVAFPTPHDSSLAQMFQFKPKVRRESVESFASQAIVSRRSIRNTTSIERSVDPEGFKTINDYTFLQNLGRGTSGKVKLAVHHGTGELRAVKVVKRSHVKKLQGPNGLERLKKEVAIMKKLHHKNIVQLFEVIDDPESDKMYFVMQYAERGEVLSGWATDLPDRDRDNGEEPFDRERGVEEPCHTPLPQEDVVRVVRQAMSGLIYLHHRGIVHFDVKPQNLLRDASGNVVLADFGVSELMVSHASNMVPCSGLGTPAYMAPEIAAGDTIVDGEAVDTWALGVSAFVLLFGRLPFRGRSVPDLFRSIEAVEYECPSSATPVQIDFFQKIFVRRPDARWTLRQLRQHEFLSCGCGMSLAGSVSMCRGDDEGSSPPRPAVGVVGVGASDQQPVPPTTMAAAQPFSGTRGFMTITQTEMNAAISRLVSPAFTEGSVGAATEGASSACPDSRSMSVAAGLQSDVVSTCSITAAAAIIPANPLTTSLGRHHAPALPNKSFSSLMHVHGLQGTSVYTNVSSESAATLLTGSRLNSMDSTCAAIHHGVVVSRGVSIGGSSCSTIPIGGSAVTPPLGSSSQEATSSGSAGARVVSQTSGSPTALLAAAEEAEEDVTTPPLPPPPPLIPPEGVPFRRQIDFLETARGGPPS